jgi:hypothetical protein
VISSLNLNPEEVLLGQGTLRPDLIESASHLVSGSADTIKTHHNDSGLVRKLREMNRVVEPLKDFHKDEVCCVTTCLVLNREIKEGRNLFRAQIFFRYALPILIQIYWTANNLLYFSFLYFGLQSSEH